MNFNNFAKLADYSILGSKRKPLPEQSTKGNVLF